MTLRHFHFRSLGISLGREFRDIGLLAQKAIAFRFRDEDDAESGEPFD